MHLIHFSEPVYHKSFPPAGKNISGSAGRNNQVVSIGWSTENLLVPYYIRWKDLHVHDCMQYYYIHVHVPLQQGGPLVPQYRAHSGNYCSPLHTNIISFLDICHFWAVLLQGTLSVPHPLYCSHPLSDSTRLYHPYL